MRDVPVHTDEIRHHKRREHTRLFECAIRAETGKRPEGLQRSKLKQLVLIPLGPNLIATKPGPHLLLQLRRIFQNRINLPHPILRLQLIVPLQDRRNLQRRIVENRRSIDIRRPPRNAPPLLRPHETRLPHQQRMAQRSMPHV